MISLVVVAFLLLSILLNVYVIVLFLDLKEKNLYLLDEMQHIQNINQNIKLRNYIAEVMQDYDGIANGKN